jgi:four helix bundle protein
VIGEQAGAQGGRTGGQADGENHQQKEKLISKYDFRYSELNGWSLMYGMMPYERFEAWKITHQLALEVYSITERWPKCERYELTSQIRRAALSAPTNIAEGASKRGRQEFRRFIDIARGSLSEVSYLLRFSKDRGILGEQDFRALDELRDRAGKVTWGLYSSLNLKTPK